MQINPSVLGRGLEITELCQQGAAEMQAHAAVVEAWRALNHHFIVDREPLKRVEAFKYLRTLLSMDDVDRRAINANLENA